MPYAVTHFLAAIFLVGLFRDYFIKDKKKFPLSYVLIGGIAGIAPDLDVFAFYIASFFGFLYGEVHRAFSHTLFVPLLFLFLGFLSYGFKNKRLGIHHLKLRNIFFVIAFGALIHILLDFLIIGKVGLFYPFSYTTAGLGLYELLPISWQDTFLYSLDAALMVGWICYLEIRHKISDFI